MNRQSPNRGFQLTALCAHKIGPILKPEFGSKAFPIYECAAAEAQIVGRAINRRQSKAESNDRMHTHHTDGNAASWRASMRRGD